MKSNLQIKPTADLDKLLSEVGSISQLENYLQSNMIPEFSSIAESLNYMLHEKKLTKSDVIKESDIDRVFAYQIFSGIKKPGRDKLLMLCIAMKLDLSETSRALAIAGHGKLYSKNTKDAVIIYAINSKLNIQNTKDLLYEFGDELE